MTFHLVESIPEAMALAFAELPDRSEPVVPSQVAEALARPTAF